MTKSTSLFFPDKTQSTPAADGAKNNHPVKLAIHVSIMLFACSALAPNFRFRVFFLTSLSSLDFSIRITSSTRLKTEATQSTHKPEHLKDNQCPCLSKQRLQKNANEVFRKMTAKCMVGNEVQRTLLTPTCTPTSVETAPRRTRWHTILRNIPMHSNPCPYKWK